MLFSLSLSFSLRTLGFLAPHCNEETMKERNRKREIKCVCVCVRYGEKEREEEKKRTKGEKEGVSLRKGANY